MKQLLSCMHPARRKRFDETMVGGSSGMGAITSCGVFVAVIAVVAVFEVSESDNRAVAADVLAPDREMRSAPNFGQVAVLRKEVFDARRAHFEVSAHQRAAMVSAHTAHR